MERPPSEGGEPPRRKDDSHSRVRAVVDAYDALPPEDHLGPWLLSSGEEELHHWRAPGGRGVLTNLRCVILSHPHPVQRSMRWSVDLEQVTALSVDRIRGLPGTRILMRGSYAGGGVISTGAIDPTYGVLVNETIVMVGEPDACADLQRRIDETRTARCLARYGRLLPYGTGTSGNTEQPSDVVAPASADRDGAAAPIKVDSLFFLFIAGEPFKDAVPGGGYSMISSAVVRGGPGGVAGFGGHERADLRPGQVYGPQAEMARMVLDIAKACGVAVTVVDVDRPGEYAALVGQYVSPDADLPILIRPDGGSLAGSEWMVPHRVTAFLQGR
jgi:hypothetical protein